MASYLIINFIESNNFIEINNIVITIIKIIVKLKRFWNYRVDIGSLVMMFYGESQYQRNLKHARNQWKQYNNSSWLTEQGPENDA